MRCLKFSAAAWLMLATVVFATDAQPNLRRTATVEVVEKAKNAVVYISSTKIVAQRFNPFGNDPFWQQFDFGPVINRPVGSLGSGFIIHPDGYIVTNNHVIDRARQITVQLLDGQKFDAELISADAEADLAILKISSDRPLPTVELGDSSDLMIGEPVIAVGNPLGYSHSVSTGIVSAVHRNLRAGDDRILLEDVIQTDAAINPGNSGGPLLNAYGQVIGINTAIRGDAQNIGFAIQINRLRDLIPELMNPEQVTKLHFPIALKEQRKISPPANVTTTVVRADDGAVVLAIAGKKPRDIIDAYAILLKQPPGQPVQIELDGHPTVVVHPRPTALADAVEQARQRLGITVVQVTPMLAEKYGLETEKGILVTEVARGSVAAKVGIQPGDVILVLGRSPVFTLADFANQIRRLPNSGRIRIGIMRGRALGYGVLEL